jgi:putative redox protein
MLYAAAECAGLTIMGILRKDEITPKRFEITVEGTLDTPTLAAESRYRSFAVHYNFECMSISNQNCVSCAIREAQEGKCGVVAMLKMIAPVSHEIAIVSSETVNV